MVLNVIKNFEWEAYHVLDLKKDEISYNPCSFKPMWILRLHFPNILLESTATGVKNVYLFQNQNSS
jgi:hypothetical protein